MSQLEEILSSLATTSITQSEAIKKNSETLKVLAQTLTSLERRVQTLENENHRLRSSYIPPVAIRGINGNS